MLFIGDFAMTGLTEKVYVLGKLPSGMSDITVGHELNVSESTLLLPKALLTETHVK